MRLRRRTHSPVAADPAGTGGQTRPATVRLSRPPKAEQPIIPRIDANTTTQGNQTFRWSNATHGSPGKGYLMAVEGDGDTTCILGNDSTADITIVVDDGSRSAAYWVADDFLL